MLAAGLASRMVADLLRLPQMLVLLAAGALLGPPVLDAIDVPLDSIGAEIVLTLGVSFILFHGGLQLTAPVLGRVAVGVGLLAIPGVVLTAVLTGAVAAVAFGVPLSMGFLIGAVLAPTDPAILIPLLERTRLRPKVSQTIVAESAVNDPTGAVLAIALSGVVLGGSARITDPLVEFVVDLSLSTVLGIVFGVMLAAFVSSARVGIWRESHAIVVLAIVTGGYVTLDSAGGSGYLGAFLAGLIVGNTELLRIPMHERHARDLRVFTSTVSDVMVIFVFVILGANLPSWSAFSDDVLPAALVLGTLIFVARPVVVLACLLADRRGAWTRREIAFVAWTRETGVVPAALAGLMVALHVPDAEVLVTTVALAIVVTLALQAPTKPWLARRLGLLER